MLTVQITALGEKKEKSKPSQWHILSKAGVYVTVWISGKFERIMCPKAALNYIKVLVSLCQWYSWGYKSGLPFLPMFLERTKPFSKWFR